MLPRLYERLAQESEDLAGGYAQLEHAAIERVASTTGELCPDQAAGAARNLATAKGIAIDKANILRGRPTEIKVTGSISELLGD